MSLFIGITSYRPDDDKIREIRTKAANTQIDYFHQILPSIRPVVVAQNFQSEEEYNPLCDYIKYEKGIGPGAARNILLKEFYASDKDFILLCDDDAIYYPYYQTEEFLQDLAFHSERFVGVDNIIPVFPQYSPFKKDVYEDIMTRTHYKFKRRYKREGAGLTILRNIVKEGGEPIYFNESITARGDGREDVEFNLDWNLHGHTAYQLTTLIFKDLGGMKFSSIFGYNSPEVFNEYEHENVKKIVERWGKYGVGFSNPEKFVVSFKQFTKLYDKSKDVLYIERPTLLTLSENEIPKEKPIEEPEGTKKKKIGLFSRKI